MISKEMFISKLQKEVHILKHLAEKVTTPELLHFKFSDTQRTTGEWMAYIALIGSATTRDVLNDDASGFSDFAQRSAQFDPTTFSASLDADVALIIDLLQATSEDTLLEEKNQWGAIDTRAGHILGVYNLYVAYKTQIFLQLKSAGLADLGTMNLWAGMDIPAKA